MMRKYRPFLIYSARRGWGFYPNHTVSPLTSRNIGSARSRRVMWEPIGWFLTADLAIMFEKRERRI